MSEPEDLYRCTGCGAAVGKEQVWHKVEEWEAEIATLQKRVSELEAEVRDRVPRSRYNVACDQYNEATAEAKRYRDGLKDIKNTIREGKINGK